MNDRDKDGLFVEEVGVRFGGLVAVDGVSLGAPKGRITGLIGPNGAGKTTTFNVCSGFIEPSRGRVHLLGHDVTNDSPSARANLGLGRTFQRMELFDSLTVLDNVAIAREARMAGSRVLRQLVGRRAERTEAVASARQALARCGIDDLAASYPSELSTGHRRLVELARAINGDFEILLLDEPSSGLDRGETEHFGAILRDVVSSGPGLLLVEHDMSLVLTICDYIYVLDFGRLIFEGTPAEVASSEIVRAAYLGSENVQPVTRRIGRLGDRVP
jgi:ABC-type branched-subunit amino acid transport system ATPase component